MAVASATLARLPVALFRALDEQVSGLLREYTLVLLGGGTQPFDLADVARAKRAAGCISAALDDGASTTSLTSDTRTLDLDLTGIDAGAYGVLQGVLDHANRLARSGELLMLPALPEVAALRNWICDEVLGQAAGAAPHPWQLPEGPLELPGAPLAVWDGMAALPTDEAWLVGDDANRIIGASDPALDLLGWDADELIGQRIVVVIPPKLREMHIASFTRGVVTGNFHLLDQPLELSAVTRAGDDISVLLTLHRHRAEKGRTVFLARLEQR